MNVNAYIKCNVCGCVTRVKVQAGWLGGWVDGWMMDG